MSQEQHGVTLRDDFESAAALRVDDRCTEQNTHVHLLLEDRFGEVFAEAVVTKVHVRKMMAALLIDGGSLQ